MTTEDLEKIRGVVKMEITSETAPIKASLEPIKSDLKNLQQGQMRLEEGQAQTMIILGQLSTAIEAVKAGLDNVREHIRADLMDLGARFSRMTKDHERRLEDLEDHAGIPNPHKN